MMEFRCIKQAFNLPTEWDGLADNYFQQTTFLSHAEKYNPCQQRYYLGMEGDKLVAGAIVYTLRLDILTFIKVKSPLRMHIVGIPCSVSSAGIFGNPEAMEALKKHIYEVEKGFILVLNLEEQPLVGSNASGKTLPTVVVSNHFTDWQDYTASLRSSYRRRLNHINQPIEGLRFEKKPCSEFTQTMYLQYLEVYKRSNGKLEKLSCDFFRHLPDDFKLTICLKNEQVIGWNIGLSNKNTHYFFLGGIDYKLNNTCKTYLRLLSNMIRDGIENQTPLIELGQTAEIPKMRMGGKPMPRYMEAHHSNDIFNKLIKAAEKMLEYKIKHEKSHPLKEVNT